MTYIVAILLGIAFPFIADSEWRKKLESQYLTVWMIGIAVIIPLITLAMHQLTGAVEAADQIAQEALTLNDLKTAASLPAILIGFVSFFVFGTLSRGCETLPKYTKWLFQSLAFTWVFIGAASAVIVLLPTLVVVATAFVAIMSHLPERVNHFRGHHHGN